MFVDTFTPATMGPAPFTMFPTPPDFDRAASPTLPINLSPAEIRAMVLEVLG